MSGEIINVLDALCEKLGVAIDWADANVLPQIETLGEHYVSYKFASSVFWVVLGGIMLILAVILIVLSQTHWAYRNDVDGLFMLLAFLLLGINVPVVIIFINDLILCNTFPEKLIFDLLTDTLKGM